MVRKGNMGGKMEERREEEKGGERRKKEEKGGKGRNKEEKGGNGRKREEKEGKGGKRRNLYFLYFFVPCTVPRRKPTAHSFHHIWYALLSPS
jgi:hypothetical protein